MKLGFNIELIRYSVCYLKFTSLNSCMNIYCHIVHIPIIYFKCVYSCDISP